MGVGFLGVRKEKADLPFPPLTSLLTSFLTPLLLPLNIKPLLIGCWVSNGNKGELGLVLGALLVVLGTVVGVALNVSCMLLAAWLVKGLADWLGDVNKGCDSLADVNKGCDWLADVNKGCDWLRGVGAIVNRPIGSVSLLFSFPGGAGGRGRRGGVRQWHHEKEVISDENKNTREEEMKAYMLQF